MHPRRSYPLIIEDEEGRSYYYYGDGAAPQYVPVRQYSDHPSPLQMVPITHPQYNPTYDHSRYDLGVYRSNSPPPPPQPPLLDVICVGIATMIPALVTLGVAKGIDSTTGRSRDGDESICTGVTGGGHITELRKIYTEVGKIPDLTGEQITKTALAIAKREDLMDLFFSVDAQGKGDLVKVIINGDA